MSLRSGLALTEGRLLGDGSLTGVVVKCLKGMVLCLGWVELGGLAGRW